MVRIKMPWRLDRLIPLKSTVLIIILIKTDDVEREAYQQLQQAEGTEHRIEFRKEGAQQAGGLPLPDP